MTDYHHIGAIPLAGHEVTWPTEATVELWHHLPCGAAVADREAHDRWHEQLPVEALKSITKKEVQQELQRARRRQGTWP